MSRIIGIDPGKNGALALIDTEVWTVAITDMPKEPGKGGKEAVSPAGVARLFDATAPDHVYIEDVWSSPQMGVVSAFNFGRNLGILEGASASRAMLTKVRPQEWKTLTKTPKDKNEARRRAMQVFPCAYDLFSRVKDDGRAEAAMIAFYAVLQVLRTAPPQPLTLAEFPSL
ncbi:ribonuclease H [Brevundimonas phage vB_BpoS-Papperlapapp]|uniref:Ribonuclease H-like protein n=1 Tax=Brevundimonas phage vB_BpoS-Domovoi TaxID=2948598 RepID=A0A9E7MR03_9CAUD|nr:ribonuclease H-like protein [Brevundimonas phage vB_BpoS-Domovoi]USN15911.1 ribonuclease H [Brevundimonas phage vB_BpoS-Papperlapapp]